MVILEVLGLAFALAMDAFAVSVANGVTIKKIKIKHALIFGLYFGFFQFLMPILGYLLGSTFADVITEYDHYVIFGILALIGGKMIYESLSSKDDEDSEKIDENPLKIKKMLILSIATSLDALAIGVSFAINDVDIWSSAGIIGLMAFCLSFVGIIIGKKIGGLFSKSAEIFGGLILIAIAIKILIDHQALF